MPTIQAIIDRQLRRWELEKSGRVSRPLDAPPAAPAHPVLTVSRMRGSGGSQLADRLARRFDYTLLHRDVIDRMCSSTGVRRQVLESLDGRVKSQIAIWCESMVAQAYTDTSDYARYLLQTIRSVAELGGVVVVGRGANFIVGPERGLHVRVVAPREARIERLVRDEGRARRDAEREADARDHERATFVRKVFARDIDDPLGYDLVVNTSSLSLDAAADLVAVAAREKFERLHAPHADRPAAHAG